MVFFSESVWFAEKLTITPEGTFLDTEKLSDVSTRQLALTDQSIMKLRFSVLPGAEHPGGCTLLVQVSEIITSIYGITIGYHPENI